MKIITVNLPVPYINTIKLLVGREGLYPSRSELIRVAIRDFLSKELKMAKNLNTITQEEKEIINNTSINGDKFVRIPTDSSNDIGNTMEYKTYKIIKR